MRWETPINDEVFYTIKEDNMLKKALSLLAVCMLLPIFAAAQGGPMPNMDITLPESADVYEQYISAFAVHEEGIYILASAGFHNWRFGEEAPILLQNSVSLKESYEEFEQISSLHIDEEGGLYAYSRRGVLLKLSVSDSGVTVEEELKLDLDEFMQTDSYSDQPYMEPPKQILIYQGRLYMILWDYSGGGQETRLISFDLTSGEKREHDQKAIQTLARFKDGNLLALVLENGGYDEVKQQPTLPKKCVYDPAAETLEDPVALKNASPWASQQFILYDQYEDDVLYADSGKIFRLLDGGDEELCGYMPSGSYYWGEVDPVVVLPGKRAAILGNERIALRSIDTALLPQVSLTIYGGYESPETQKAALAMPEVPVTFVENLSYSSVAELGQALVSGEDAIDILVLSCTWMDILNLMEKGYVADLGSSALIKDHVGRMYPQIAQECMADGKVYAIPVRISMDNFLYNPMLFGKLGIDPPATFGDLIAFIVDWTQEYAEDYPDYKLHSDEALQAFSRKAITLYSDYLGYMGEEIKLDTPLFRELMTQTQALLDLPEGEKLDWSDQAAMDAFFSRPSAIEEGYGMDLEGMSQRWIFEDDLYAMRPVILRVSEDAPAVASAEMELMLVNAQGKNVETAIRYVENYIQAQGGGTRAMLFPDQNEPVINENYDMQIKYLSDSIALVKESIRDAEGAEKTEMETQLKSMEDLITNKADQFKYAVSREAIDSYRATAQHLYVRTYRKAILDRQENIYELFNRFFDGQLPLEQLIREADGRLRLMMLENQ